MKPQTWLSARFGPLAGRLDTPSAQRALMGIALALVLSVPLFADDRYVNIFIVWGINILLATSICLLSGFTGQFSMGQAAFYAVGAYVTGSLTTVFGWPLWASIPLAVLGAAFVGFVVSLPAGRVSDFYLAVVTLALLIITGVVIRNWADVTGGFSGLVGIESVSLLNLEVLGFEVNQETYFYVVAVVAVLVLLVASNLIRSPIGRAFVCVRESELAASTLGIRPGYVKKLAFVLSAGLAGLAGVLYSHSVGYLSSESFAVNATVAILAMGVLGGLGTVRGAVLGSAVLTFVPDQLQGFDEYQLIGYGAVLLVTYIAFPQGLSGLLPGRQQFVRQPGRSAPAGAPAEVRPGAFERGTFERGTFAHGPSESKRLMVTDLSMRFGGVRALDGVSMSVEPGEIRGLIGPNGSGKSTLLNVVSGIYRPTAGSVHYGDAQIEGLRSFKVARHRIARTFQHPVLVDEMTVLENTLLGSYGAMRVGWLRSALSTTGARRRERELVFDVTALLVDLGLGDLMDRPVRDLPFGRRRMVELARALVARPTLLMLDEPAAGLSQHELDGLAALVREVRSTGTTVIVVEHHMDFLMNLVDSCTVLDNGRVIFEGTPAEATQSPAVRDAYLGLATPATSERV